MLPKITGSLIFLLVLAIGLSTVATPAAAQGRSVVGQTGFDPPLTPEASEYGFYVYLNTGDGLPTVGLSDSPAPAVAESGIVLMVRWTGAGLAQIPAVPGASSSDAMVYWRGDVGNLGDPLPNLENILRYGGTIELAVQFSDAVPSDLILEDLRHLMVITEVMWGLDTADPDPASKQWIEFHYDPSHKMAEKLGISSWRFVVTENVRVSRIGQPIDITTGENFAPGAPDGRKYYVVDMVSLINRFGQRWEPPGSSGRTAVGTNGEPVTNLVSMYRKRELNASGTAYKADTSFDDGSEGDSWAASVGRINMDGPYIGTPGAVQQDDGGQVVSAKDPASLPVGSVIINEIYNSEGLQWIELHNTGAAEVNVKNWELEAALGGTDKKDLQRVFTIPDKDTKIPAGGFLVVTNQDPSETILAGGVDLHDTNNDKFPAGASQLYIVIPEGSVTAKDKKQPAPHDHDRNEWMPDKGFLLILRNGNDKNDHAKIVDIAGNAFDKVVSPAIVTDVWPLKGWTVPGNRHDNSFGNAANSLMQNVGKTYARDGQKNRAGEPLHKDDWLDNGAGIVGGLGYDPGVDLAIAPGTPGYANNAQKANPADITGEVVISEIMYDAGANGNLVQWIELYNASMTESALLNGDWELEIRNIDTDVESYVDAKFDFKDAVVLPNQTLLLVSDRSSASDVQPNRVYNLYQQHRNELGLSARKSILLSSVGFHLELRYKDTVVDEGGNVMLDGPRRSVMWALPETGGDMRSSILRGFGTMAFDGTPDDADDGTMASSWITAQSVGSYYGHRDDVGSPGHREGSPLPVSLSSFRPVRDKATGEVVIRWVTESELNNAGFNILRADSKDDDFKVINVKGIIAGHGTTSEKHVYTYTDTTAKPNVVYYYQIEDVSLDGERTTLRTTHLRGNVSAGGKLTTTWANLKAHN